MRIATQIIFEAAERGVIQHLLRVGPSCMQMERNVPAILDLRIDAPTRFTTARDPAGFEAIDQHPTVRGIERVVVDLDKVGKRH